MTKKDTIRERDRAGDRWVLILIGGGIIFTVNLVIVAIWNTSHNDKSLPDMAEVVFGAIIGGALVKLADVLSALVTLATGRQLEKQSEQLAQAGPPQALAPPDARDAAQRTAEAAQEEADQIGGREEWPIGERP